MPTDQEKFDARLHMVDLHEGAIPKDLKIDASKIHRIRHDRGEIKGARASFRYIFAIRGSGRSAASVELRNQLEQLEKAKDSLHDRVLDFPSGEGNGIFALYMDYPGTAERVLGITKSSKYADKNGQSDFSPNDKVRIAKVVEKLRGTKIVVIRGAFDSEEAFANALSAALGHDPVEKYALIEDILRQPLITAKDLASVAAMALEKTGDAIERVLPNVPPIRMTSQALHKLGNTFSRRANLDSNTPRIEAELRDSFKTYGPVARHQHR